MYRISRDDFMRFEGYSQQWKEININASEKVQRYSKKIMDNMLTKSKVNEQLPQELESKRVFIAGEDLLQ
jgi:hypothetical protein